MASVTKKRPFHLISSRGCGSAIVEAIFELANLPYTNEVIGFMEKGPARDRLLKLNPLGQVPTLVLPDGRILTESAAIVLYVHDVCPEAKLIPSVKQASRPLFFRWLEFMVCAIYPTFAYGDHPAKWVSGKGTQDEFLKNIHAHRQSLWRMVEDQIQPSPWFLGDPFSALDVYVGVMSHWRPRRDWFETHCPKLFSVARKTDAIPQLRMVWKRNEFL